MWKNLRILFLRKLSTISVMQNIYSEKYSKKYLIKNCIYIYIYGYIYMDIYILYIYIYIYKFTSKCHRRTTPSQEWRQPEPGNGFSTLCLQANPQLGYRVLKPPSLPINPKFKGIESIYILHIRKIYTLFLFYKKCIFYIFGVHFQQCQKTFY